MFGSVKRWTMKALGLSRLSMRRFRGWIMEPFTGAWQKNGAATLDDKDRILQSSAVYACVTGIAADISKMRIKLSRNKGGVWTEVTTNEKWLAVLKKPNHYQNRIKFIEQWIISKLLSGNAYILKKRDETGAVVALYPLDPQRVEPLVAEDGSIFYRLSSDAISLLPESQVIVPAREIIHDSAVSLWHPLLGTSPLSACALSATLGNKIHDTSIALFENKSLPGGVLSSPGIITKEQVESIKEQFEKNFGGKNVGKIAVLGGDMRFSPIQLTAEASQLIEQLKWTVEDIARAFHYPTFKLGAPLPPYAGNVEALIMTYYTDCLQTLIESLELNLDEGLELPADLGTELDLDNLMRMDTAALFDSNNKAVNGGWMKPNEARFRANYGKVEGGDTPYLQQQNYSLAALAKRDAREDPFGSAKPPAAEPPPVKQEDYITEEEKEILFEAEWRKEFAA
jgi:HK97 family phage portal protein